MISLLLLDVGLSCFVCLVQVITDCARAAEGKFFLSFHPTPPPPPFLHSLLPQIPHICLLHQLFTSGDSIFPLPRKIKSIDCPCCVWFHWMCCEWFMRFVLKIHTHWGNWLRIDNVCAYFLLSYIFFTLIYRLLPVEENFLSKFQVGWSATFLKYTIVRYQVSCTDIF